MSTEKDNNICSASNITGKSLLNTAIVQNKSSKVTNACNPYCRTHFNFAPWFELDCLKQNSTASINSTSELKKVLNGEKKKEMFSKLDAVYNFNSFNNVSVLDEKEGDTFQDPLEVPLQDVSEDEKAELRKRMLGYFD